MNNGPSSSRSRGNGRTRFVGPLLLLALLGVGCTDPRPVDRPLAQKLLELAPQGRDLEAFLERSTLESERFRRGLLVEPDGGMAPARLIARAIVRFREIAPAHLAGRCPITGFKQSARELEGWIAGTRGRISGDEVYGGFRGRWYGLWETMKVDHHWGDFVELESPRRFRAEEGNLTVYLRGYQFAWVGDGYGINHLVTTDPARSGDDHLLGHVVHVKEGDLDQEVACRPHVGIPAGPGRIIWLTGGEVFLEERTENAEREEEYAITGFFYTLEGGVLRASRAFQAIYSRRKAERAEWHGFPMELVVRPDR